MKKKPVVSRQKPGSGLCHEVRWMTVKLTLTSNVSSLIRQCPIHHHKGGSGDKVNSVRKITMCTMVIIITVNQHDLQISAGQAAVRAVFFQITATASLVYRAYLARVCARVCFLSEAIITHPVLAPSSVTLSLSLSKHSQRVLATHCFTETDWDLTYCHPPRGVSL